MPSLGVDPGMYRLQVRGLAKTPPTKQHCPKVKKTKQNKRTTTTGNCVSQKMVYKRVRIRTTGRSLSV